MEGKKKGGLLTNIFVVFSVQNPFKVHEKTRCVCRTVRTVSQTWALAFFWTISMQFQRKRKKRMRLIWSCAPVFSLFYLTLNLWVGLIGPKYVNTKWASCEQMKLGVIWFFFVLLKLRVCKALIQVWAKTM